jgi:hypothetical protein
MSTIVTLLLSLRRELWPMLAGDAYVGNLELSVLKVYSSLEKWAVQFVFVREAALPVVVL